MFVCFSCLPTKCMYVVQSLSQNFGVSNIGLGKRVTLIRNALGRTSGTVVYVGLHTSIVGLLLSLSSIVGLFRSLSSIVDLFRAGQM